jgi:hypothetical protein
LIQDRSWKRNRPRNRMFGTELLMSLTSLCQKRGILWNSRAV